MSKRITIKDVALKAGVTHTTVSRVIHNDSRISEATRKRVQLALESLGYQPNLVARGLVQNRTQLIALITPELAPHTQPIVRSVAEACSKQNYATLLFPTNTWEKETLSFESLGQNWLVDGTLVYNLVYHEKVPAEILDLQARRVPFVFVNKFLNAGTVNAVGVDNDYAVGLAVEHLAGLGRKRIGALYGNLTSVDGAERHQAFLKAMARLNLECDEDIVACGYWYEDPAYQKMQKMLTLPNPPDAVFCANDTMAIGVLAAIREKGLRVPQDIAVSGFDDIEIGRYIPTPLTTIRAPLFEAGMRAFELLMDVLQNPGRPAEQFRLKSELIVRASTVQ